MACHTLDSLTTPFFLESHRPVRVKIRDLCPGLNKNFHEYPLRYFTEKFIEGMRSTHPGIKIFHYTSLSVSMKGLVVLGIKNSIFEVIETSNIRFMIHRDESLEELIIERLRVPLLPRKESMPECRGETMKVFEMILKDHIRTRMGLGVTYEDSLFKTYYELYVTPEFLDCFVRKCFPAFKLIEADDYRKVYEVESGVSIIFSFTKDHAHPIRIVGGVFVSKSGMAKGETVTPIGSFLEGMLKKVHASNDKYTTLVDEMIEYVLSQDRDVEIMKFIHDLSGKMKDTPPKDVVGYGVCYALEMLCQSRLSN